MPSISFRGSEGDTQTARQMSLNAHEWRGRVWKHRIVIIDPAKQGSAKDAAILIITGGEPNEKDFQLGQVLADATRMPAALLFSIPNQPIDSLNEDELIAHTFDRYLETGEPSWPLLFPMVKSTIAAMNALEEATQGSKTPLSRFVVTGESKRGWTTWLAAATGDNRIIGIAPMVFDNLNIEKQMAHQLESWGRYSEMIEAYTKRDLPSKAQTERGQKLVAMVDPYSYRKLLTMPKLIVNGANDPYWTVDALSLYWDGLVGPKSAMIAPNSGHNTGEKPQTMLTVGLFARACAGEFAWPQPKAVWEGGTVKVELGSDFGSRTTAWVAHASNLDFRQSAWKVFALSEQRLPAFDFNGIERPFAVLVQIEYRLPTVFGANGFELSLPIRVFR